MAKIKPFHGVRFNKKSVGSLSKVVCPPYDVINKQQRKNYLSKSDYNVVSLVLPKGGNKPAGYENSKKLLNKWLNSGVLIHDEKPCVYVYIQKYKVGKTTKSRMGFMALLELQDGKKRKVLPHEKIFDKFKFERSRLMRTTQSHLSPIFTVFKDKGKKVDKLLSSAIKGKKPIANIDTKDVEEKLWNISDDKIIHSLEHLIKNEELFIADGHHRFEASLYTRDYLRVQQRSGKTKMPYDYTMVYFLSMQNKGMVILPTHRTIKYLPKGFSKELLLKKLSKHFSVSLAKNKQELLKKMEAADKKAKNAFGFFYKNTYIFAALKDTKIIKSIGPTGNCLSWKKLDVSILHYFILPELLGIKEKAGAKRNIYYYRGIPEAIKMVKSKDFKLAIFLNSTKIEEVEAVAKAGNKMPHKSTYFYPKLLTGLVIHKF